MNIRTLVKLEKLSSGRTFVFADLHGSYSKLMRSLDEVAFDESCDRIILVGDIIDRGEENESCLELLSQSYVYSVIGNHDYIPVHLSNLKSQGLDDEFDFWFNQWMLNGGEWVRNSHWDVDSLAKLFGQTMSVFCEFFASDARVIGVSHAAVPGYNWKNVRHFNGNLSDEHSPTWDRSQLKNSTRIVSGVDEVVHGHTVHAAPIRLGNRHYIDTGAFLDGGTLSYRVY